eukprot:CAMPEP_0185621602 /NCGR_PEP_ID=MMETSP0436-20130131/57915_1 /TAXON_ID=626734 ORGANISM="Favella taraikaensis, Strain Fe Narragansett Bay" /NCGR_SAMPLE_ID=MMETSP0436 /ASSEMBLY_ACC=CAM_ASM_000390 /LENGTH=56 /DNA_ID=CAMNT_0028263019 /DNA_START=1 /DNA_END=168 /DNA_ORIENTATION=+
MTLQGHATCTLDHNKASGETKIYCEYGDDDDDESTEPSIATTEEAISSEVEVWEEM